MAIISIPGFSDPVSSLSHLLAAGVFLLLSIPLVRRGRGSATRTLSLAVFCVGAVFLLAISGAYHLLAPDTAGREVLQRLDHAAIFVLIASSFTPAHAILFRGVGRWGMLLLIWSIAAAAITAKVLWFHDMPSALSLSLYLGMGWIGLATGIPLWRKHGFRFVELLFWGGVAYSIGAVLDFMKWPVIIPGVVQSHEVFHVFVLIGLSLHWSFNYVIADGRIDGDHRANRHGDPQRGSDRRSNDTSLEEASQTSPSASAISAHAEA